MKRLIQCYKGAGQWTNSPPGLGDFIRGTSHLHELLCNSGLELVIDMSQSGFSEQLITDPFISSTADSANVALAEEYFEDHGALLGRIQTFVQSDQPNLYVSTNLGAWNRTTLPPATISFMRRLLQFTPQVASSVLASLPVTNYEVVSFRCGDAFYSGGETPSHTHLMRRAEQFLENIILPRIRHPLVLTSDSYELKCALAERYGLLYLPHRSEHGAFNQTTLPVALDLYLLSRSKYNYHVNLWAAWWSGFSHYTSVIFSIPSLNMRAPEFRVEEISADGKLTLI